MKQSAEFCRNLLRSGYKPEYRNGYPYYDEHVIDILRALENTKTEDYNYLDHIEAVRSKKMQALSIEDVCTYLTYIFRRERFCDGHIANYIENGILLSVLERYIELV